MKTLIITAHPSKKGFTHKIAEKYKEAKGNSEIINLYKQNCKQDFLYFQDKQDLSKETPKKKFFHEKIRNAEEIVFIHPIWWGATPAILKNWIDINLSPEFAFTYENSKPKGLLEGKKVKIFMTSGSPAEIYGKSPIKELWKSTLEFCGMRISEIKIFGSFDTKDRDEKKVLEEIQNSAKK